MSLNGVEMLDTRAFDRALESFDVNAQLGNHEVAEEFRALVEGLVERMLADRLAETAAPTPDVVPDSGPSGAVATPPVPPSPTETGRSLGANASSMLLEPDKPLLKALANDLTAGDPQYNQREVLLRERLDLPGLEARLRASAEAAGLTFTQGDLDGVLRNAGYDAAHLGASDRYMAAIEKFMGEAEARYQRNANNVPGSNA